MPVLKNRTIFELTRGVTAFLNLEVGLTRNEIPQTNGARTRILEQIGRRLTGRDREIAQLQPKSAQEQGGTYLSCSDGGPPMFFVVGRSRSASTWLMRLLNAHPEIPCMGEGRFFGRNWREERMKEMQVNKQPSSLYNALSSSEYLRFWIERSVWTRGEDSDEHLNNLTRAAINYFLTQKLRKTGKRIVGDKTPLLGPGIIKEISTIYPEAKVVHIIRDGRDQAVSLMHYFWNTVRDEGGLYHLEPEELAKREAYRKDPQELVETGGGMFTEKRLGKMASNWSTWVGETIKDGPALLGANYTEVRYEDLLDKPEEDAERLLRFLGAEASRKTVEQCVRLASFEMRTKGREKGQEDPTSIGFRKGVAGDWKDVFTERDKQIFKEIAGELLIEAGYEKDSNW